MMFLAAAVLASTLSIENYATMPTLASPRFSPDGKRVAYVLTHADLVKSAYDSDVWVIDTDGTYDTEVEHGTHPRWSPDGKTVACLYENAIWAEGKKVTEEPGPIHDFEYSPDGGSIAFIETDAAKKSEREDFHVVGAEVRQAHLYVMDLGTRAVRRLTQGDFSINSMSWTPDGKTLVVERLPRVDLDSLYDTDLYTLDVASATMTPLVVRRGADRAPKVSPDGRRVAFISMGGVHDWLREQRLWVIDLQTHTMQVASREYDGSPESIHWLDANTLAFDGAVGTTTQIFYAAAAGRATQKTHFAGVAADIDVNAGRIAYIYQSLSQPPEVYVDDKQLTHHNDAFREKRRPETRVIHWKKPERRLGDRRASHAAAELRTRQARPAPHIRPRRPRLAPRSVIPRLSRIALRSRRARRTRVRRPAPQSARYRRLRREVPPRQSQRMGRRHVARHQRRHRQADRGRRRRSLAPRPHGLELRRLHRVVGHGP
jgi:dipeptidyl aminopeptidase/acylaminoacyl peptidase